MKYDFSGYVTRNDLKCSDERTIKKDAFKGNDAQTVPLVWQHLHNEPTNVLGHVLLENREDGVYGYGKFNDTDAAVNASKLVKHGDITALSIYANQLKQQGKNVMHGVIREVSLVLAGANPGAYIDNLNFVHSDDDSIVVDETEAIITTGLELEVDTEVKHSEGGDQVPKEKSVQEVLDTLTEEQQNVVYAIIGEALADEDTDSEDDGSAEHSDEGGTHMNVFEGKEKKDDLRTLTHDEFGAIAADAKKNGGSLKDSFMAHAGNYGIDNIGFLFPDATNITPVPTLISREMGWVQHVLNATRHTPFSRIKTTQADITAEEARAKGYVTGAEKTDEVFGLLQRITTPTTIYKKQKLDRDDVVDIVDLDVVAFLKMEMRVMLDEEIARAVLISDGRAANHADKIKEANIRPIYKDDDLYAHKIALANDITVANTIDAIISSREFYRGSGNPTMYTSTATLLSMLLLKDTLGRRLYETKASLAAALLVNDIVEVPVMPGVTRIRPSDDKVMSLVAIIVNLKDYAIGADKGGAVNMFDDFDIDFNQFKYLIETRISGALTLPKSAIVIEKLPVA